MINNEKCPAFGMGYYVNAQECQYCEKHYPEDFEPCKSMTVAATADSLRKAEVKTISPKASENVLLKSKIEKEPKLSADADAPAGPPHPTFLGMAREVDSGMRPESDLADAYRRLGATDEKWIEMRIGQLRRRVRRDKRAAEQVLVKEAGE